MRKFAIFVGLTLCIMYFVSAIYTIGKGVEQIKRSSYNLGCMSVPNMSYDQVEQCKALYDREKLAPKRAGTTT